VKNLKLDVNCQEVRCNYAEPTDFTLQLLLKALSNREG